MKSFQILPPTLCSPSMFSCRRASYVTQVWGQEARPLPYASEVRRKHGACWCPALSVASTVCTHLPDKQMASLAMNLIFLKC